MQNIWKKYPQEKPKDCSRVALIAINTQNPKVGYGGVMTVEYFYKMSPWAGKYLWCYESDLIASITQPQPAASNNALVELKSLLEDELQYLIRARTALNWLHDLKEPTQSHNMKFAVDGIDLAVNRTVKIENFLSELQTTPAINEGK